jgi:hypothetical protein
MKTFRIVAFAAAAAATCAAFSPDACAEPTKKDNDYGYTFKDDLLQAGELTSQAAQIRVLNKGRRDLLLRPRLHFVQEMLKSVENM